MRLFIFLLLLPICTWSQVSYSGVVRNKRTNEIIPFATVGLIKENIGTNAGEDGRFTLVSHKGLPFDTLLFTSVGYLPLKFPVGAGNTSDLSIQLEERESNLDEVFVSNKTAWQHATLNDFSGCGNSFISSNGAQTQLAQHFQVPQTNAMLTEVKICRRNMGILDPEKTMFRIRIYDMDTLTTAPSKDLCDKVIEVKSRSKTISIDVKKYRIYIPNKDFFVAVEWLKVPFNENKSRSKLADGTVVETITYRPSIGWTKNIGPIMEAWMLDYKNVWRPMFKMGNKTSVAISATVRY